MAGTVMYGVLVYDPLARVGSWIVEGKWCCERYKTHVVEFVKLSWSSPATRSCLCKLYAVCKVHIRKLVLSRRLRFALLFSSHRLFGLLVFVVI